MEAKSQAVTEAKCFCLINSKEETMSKVHTQNHVHAMFKISHPFSNKSEIPVKNKMVY